MKVPRFRQLLDIHGCELERWPQSERRAAQRLLSEDPAAIAAHEAAVRLAGLLDRYPALPPAGADARILGRLAALPPQQRSFVHLPALLSRWDFTPSWARIVTLASMAALGIVIGLNDGAPGDVPTADLSAFVFDGGPGVGLGP